MMRSGNRQEKIYLLQQFKERLLNYELWLDKGDELVNAARALEPQINNFWKDTENHHGKESNNTKKQKENKISAYPLLQDIYFMQIGYALENYFKMIIIQESSEALQDQINIFESKLPTIIKDHDLFKLAKKAGFKLNQNDEELIARIQNCSIWQGRYPIPVDSEGLKNIFRTASGGIYFTAYMTLGDLDRVNLLIDRVKSLCQQILDNKQQQNKTTSEI